MLNGLVISIVALVTQFIGSMGYWGIGVCMAIESCNVPLPSEVILPFGGYLVSIGSLTFFGAAMAGAAGGTIGSLVSYCLGLWGGRSFLERHGKHIGLPLHRLKQADQWFVRYGKATVFISRLIPGIRTFISLPAGAARLSVGYFTILTFLGSLIWSLLLTYIGLVLGDNWRLISPWFHRFDILILVSVFLAISFFWWKKKHKEVVQSEIHFR